MKKIHSYVLVGIIFLIVAAVGIISSKIFLNEHKVAPQIKTPEIPIQVVKEDCEDLLSDCRAIANDDTSYCNISNRSIGCSDTYFLFKSQKETVDCDKILDETTKIGCQFNLDATIEFCNKLDGTISQMCNVVITGECEKCAQFSTQERIECEKGCYVKKATKTQNTSLCDKIEDVAASANCKAFIQKDDSVCHDMLCKKI